ncbi:hypothetical protein [Maliponia aquimaris]|uniref:SnoaL-like domain-containing protein n=1 Tax=Maliponia aquimaris TaxID=1673631 RepID=A0A238JYE5_9RHOB|nr:hypothetical protein [Maliponia aquimaris]SMX35669.1 hypothetical protein MAA8898_00605 [Maliponia aquimaris]
MKDEQTDTGRAQDAPQPSDPLAQAHYQAMLDRINRHFWARDWQALGDCISVPNRISSLDAERVVDTIDEWLELARAARQSFVQVGATEYHRICTEARFDDAARTRITGAHKTYILRNSSLVLPVYCARMTLAWTDGVWLSSSLFTASRDKDLPTIHADRVTRRA